MEAPVYVNPLQSLIIYICSLFLYFIIIIIVVRIIMWLTYPKYSYETPTIQSYGVLFAGSKRSGMFILQYFMHPHLSDYRLTDRQVEEQADNWMLSVYIFPFLTRFPSWVLLHYIDALTSDQVHVPNSKVNGANMGPTWGQQDPGGPQVGHMNLAIWVCWKGKPIKIYEYAHEQLCFTSLQPVHFLLMIVFLSINVTLTWPLRLSTYPMYPNRSNMVLTDPVEFWPRVTITMGTWLFSGQLNISCGYWQAIPAQYS